MCGSFVPFLMNNNLFFGFLVIEETEHGKGFVFISPRGILPVSLPLSNKYRTRMIAFKQKLQEAERKAGIDKPYVEMICGPGISILATIRKMNVKYGYPGFGGLRKAA